MSRRFSWCLGLLNQNQNHWDNSSGFALWQYSSTNNFQFNCNDDDHSIWCFVRILDLILLLPCHLETLYHHVYGVWIEKIGLTYLCMFWQAAYTYVLNVKKQGLLHFSHWKHESYGFSLISLYECAMQLKLRFSSILPVPCTHTQGNCQN